MNLLLGQRPLFLQGNIILCAQTSYPDPVCPTNTENVLCVYHNDMF